VELSGRDDSVLFATPGGAHGTDGGYNILSDLDTDGDGSPDLVYTVMRETATAGAIYVYSNLGHLRYRLTAHWGNSKLGKVGDVDHDGCDDFGYWVQVPRGIVRVVSGRTGATIFDVWGDNQDDGLGSGGIVACGDVNRDGTPDFAASSEGYYPTLGIVRVVSGKDGTVIYTFRKAFDARGSAWGWGRSIASGFDLDQDGIQDLVVGDCQYDCDQVRQLGDRLYVYLLRDGREIEICTPGLASIQHFTWFGYEVAVGKPTPGNPFPVFACGEQQYGQSGLLVLYEGRVTLFRLPPAALRPYGSSCPGSLGRSPRAGMVDLGSSGVRMQVSDAPAGLPAVLLAGTSNQTWGSVPLPLALDPWGLIGCQLDTSIVLALPTLTGRAGMTEGYTALDIALPIANGASRGRLYAQWLVLGFGAQAPGALSSAMSWPY